MKSRKLNKKKKAPIQKTRKQLRKEKRLEKKVNRAQYHSQKKQTPGKFVLKPKTSENEVPEAKNDIELNKKNANILKSQLKEQKQQKIAKENERKRKNQLLKDNESEDRMIQQMEKKLKLNKRKSKTTPKSFAADGLDYLLDFCNDENRKLAVETERQLLGEDAGSDFEEDFAMMTGKDLEAEASPENSDDSSGSEDAEEDESIDASDNSGESADFSSEDDNSADFEKDEEEEENEDEDEEDEEENEEEEDEEEEASIDEAKSGKTLQKKAQANESSPTPQNPEEDTWEDIYGRKRDRSGNVLPSTGKYIPPAARLKSLESSTKEDIKTQRLRKQLKGLINRLAEHNMHTIANEIDELYMSNSRNNMNELLSKLMMESIVAPVMTPDRLIAEHMMLIAILHANVGTEVGAHFLLSLVRKLDEMMKSHQEVENKELDNLMLMISHLYNFKVFGGQLLYEILEKLCEKFGEKEIEIILVILRTVGFLLRKDDPLALKELIMKLQQKATTAKSMNSRVQFMLDVLMAIKNNNMSKIPQFDPQHTEHLKKMLRSFLRKGNVVTQFNITLEDLLKVDERGKWWIVGSAWTGNVGAAKSSGGENVDKPLYSQKILELARKQRMNTDVRRNIFCILMTAEDFMDAFEKIHHLGLKDQQAREIIYVLMDCCLQEKSFNPYYAVLAQKFCDYDRKNQMTLQYSLWDKLKALDDYSNIQLRNLAKFLSHLFLEKALPLSVLKTVQFGELDKPTMRLIRQIMLGLLLHDNTEECLQVFERISLSQQLQTFREGLRLFISHFLIKNADSKSLPESQVQRLKDRAELIDRILLTRVSRTIL